MRKKRTEDAPRVLTRAQMKAAEQAADAAGTSYAQLMENAGAAAAKKIEELAGGKKSLLLLCGSGNNAGDAFVIGRLLAGKGWPVSWLDVTTKGAYSPLAEENLRRLPAEAHKVKMEDAPFGAEVLVDGVFGTGFHGALPEGVRQVFCKANGAAGLRVALDIPSGLDCDTGAAAADSFRAAHTLTFGAYKPALLMPECAPYCGRVWCLDIGL